MCRRQEISGKFPHRVVLPGHLVNSSSAAARFGGPKARFLRIPGNFAENGQFRRARLGNCRLGRREARITRPSFFWMFYCLGRNGVGWGKELVLWCWPVVLFVAARWRVFWATCPSVPGAIMSSQWRCRHVFCTNTSVTRKPFDHMKREVSYYVSYQDKDIKYKDIKI